eukprot:GHVT01100264.1.p1 GENE.GHVT01100264.1~~GHVT01100264.1.p1  ORF type:complete len:499 (+),score=91.02 GHVT01100264.1:31-1527(+)
MVPSMHQGFKSRRYTSWTVGCLKLCRLVRHQPISPISWVKSTSGQVRVPTETLGCLRLNLLLLHSKRCCIESRSPQRHFSSSRETAFFTEPDVGTSRRDSSIFSVLSYNIMKQLTGAEGFMDTIASVHSQSGRVDELAEEILSLDQDILCLQEVQVESLQLLRQLLCGPGRPYCLACVCYQRRNAAASACTGCCIFYRGSKFVLRATAEISLVKAVSAFLGSQRAASSPRRLAPELSAFQRLLQTKRNVSAFAFLEERAAVADSGDLGAGQGAAHPARPARGVGVASVHLHFRPSAPDIKLLQAAGVSYELKQLVAKASKAAAALRGSCVVRPPGEASAAAPPNVQSARRTSQHGRGDIPSGTAAASHAARQRPRGVPSPERCAASPPRPDGNAGPPPHSWGNAQPPTSAASSAGRQADQAEVATILAGDLNSTVHYQTDDSTQPLPHTQQAGQSTAGCPPDTGVLSGVYQSENSRDHCEGNSARAKGAANRWKLYEQ